MVLAWVAGRPKGEMDRENRNKEFSAGYVKSKTSK